MHLFERRLGVSPRENIANVEKAAKRKLSNISNSVIPKGFDVTSYSSNFCYVSIPWPVIAKRFTMKRDLYFFSLPPLHRPWLRKSSWIHFIVLACIGLAEN